MFRNILQTQTTYSWAALLALKSQQRFQKFSKHSFTLPLAIMVLLQKQGKAKMINQISQKIGKSKPNGIIKYCHYFFRFVQLALIFLPSILILPLAIFRVTRVLWMNCFVWSISKAGVVWIKVFQHMSHRGDVIGDDLAESFEILRSFSPEHSYDETVQIFKRVFNETPQVFFDYIKKHPIASGSISQVYQAVFRGKKVAVKVRHPNIEKNIEIDIDIVFAAGKFLSLFSTFFEIPIDQNSFREKLTEQLDFNLQKRNLEKFNRIFTNPEVNFPQPFYESNSEVLIMDFMPGLIMTDFERAYNKRLRKYVARIGASAFFEMLFLHNFTHVDCHGGNLMVKINKDYSIWTELRDYGRIMKSFIWINVIKMALKTPYLRQLAKDHNIEEMELRMEMIRQRATAQVSLLDVGMVIELEEEKRKYFLRVLAEVIEANPKKCAEMIYGISKYRGQPLEPGQYPKYTKDLQEMFRYVEGKDLKDIKGLDILKGMLRVIRKHKMKLDGEFATLLTNMLALEGIAKKLDPEINIMRCAVPYLPYM